MDLDHRKATELLNTGYAAEACALLRDICARHPEDWRARFSLGLAEERLGNPAGTVAAMHAVIATRPNIADAHAGLGRALFALGRAAESEASLRSALQLQPDAAPLHSDLGVALQVQNKTSEAIAAYRHAIELDADAPDAWFNLGVCLQKKGDFETAATAYHAVLERSPEHFEACMNLAAALGSANRLEEAIKAFQQGVVLRPYDPEVGYRLALALEQTHQLAQAYEVLTRILVYAPGHPACALLLARLERRAGDVEAARKHLDSIDMAGLAVEMTSKVHTEYARILEQQGDFKTAFTSYARAQEGIHMTREARSLRASGWLDHVACLRNRITSDQVATWPVEPAGRDGQPPVFLVGHPRSGTTLVEQVLAAHPRFATNDERPILRAQAERFRKAHGQDGWIAALDKLPSNEVQALRAAYREAGAVQVRNLLPGNRLIDKNPLNLVELAFVRRIFPEARVLMVLRDPRDVCLSCFTQLFTLNSAMAWFTSLDDTARHYAAVMDLWQHYRTALGLAVFEFRYEYFVADLEASTRRILEFLGEDWDPAVLQYHEQSSQRYISTPSYEGVTALPYTKSIGRWRHFSGPLSPILPALQPFVDAFGY